MIKFSHTLYEFDPVQSIFHKSNYQTSIEESNEFPDRLRFEKRQIEYLNCNLVLTAYNGIKWNLITGLQSVGQMPGLFTGNRKLFSGKTEMLVIHSKGLTGEFHLYHFPGYDTKTARQRIKAAKDFISFLHKKRAIVETTAPIFLQISMQHKSKFL